MKGDRPCVYYISDGQGHCKVGIATNLNSRMNTLQVGSANELKLLHVQYYDDIEDAREQESYAHGVLNNHKIRGEWFEESAVAEFISNGCRTSDEIPKDLPDGFDFNDIIKEFMLMLECKSPMEYIERHVSEMPMWLIQQTIDHNNIETVEAYHLHLAERWLWYHTSKKMWKKYQEDKKNRELK